MVVQAYREDICVKVKKDSKNISYNSTFHTYSVTSVGMYSGLLNYNTLLIFLSGKPARKTVLMTLLFPTQLLHYCSVIKCLIHMIVCCSNLIPTLDFIYQLNHFCFHQC